MDNLEKSDPQEVEKQDPLADVSREKLLDIIRDKAKEAQKLTKQRDKVSEAYKTTFKEHAQLTKDRDVLEKVLLSIFNEPPYQMSQRPLGKYEFEEIKELYQKREDEKQKILQQLMEATNKEKCDLEERYKQMTEKQIQGMDQQTQQIVKQLNHQIQDLESNNTKLAKEIIELNDIITMKSHEISILKKIEDEFTTFKTQNLMKDLEDLSTQFSDQNDVQKRLKRSDNIDETLKLQNRIETLVGKHNELQQVIRNQNEEIGIFLTIFEAQLKKELSESSTVLFKQNNFTQHQKLDYYVNPLEEDDHPQRTLQHDLRAVYSTQSVSTQTEVSQMVEIDLDKSHSSSPKNYYQHYPDVNPEYLKNVLIKFFLFQETRNYKEAAILKNALITILKLSPQERAMLEQARQQQGSYWQTAKGYVTDHVFCYKQGLSGYDNYNNGQTPISLNPHTNMMNEGNLMK